MKSLVMSLAHKIKSTFKTFSQALKAAWRIVKRQMGTPVKPRISLSSKANVLRTAVLVKKGKEVFGQIRGLMFDKRTDSEYYRIVCTDGKTYHVRTNRYDVII